MKNSIFKYSIQIIFLLLCVGTNLLLTAAPDNKKTELLIADSKKILIEYPDSALILLGNAEKLAMIEGDNKNLCEIYRLMGNSYHYKGDYNTSLDYYFKALTLRKNSNINESDSARNAEIGNLFNNIAINYNYLGEYAKAIEYALKLEEIYTVNRDWEKLGFRCYSFIANVYYYLSDYPKALEFTYKELAVCEKHGDVVGVSYAKDMLGVIKQIQGLNDEALKFQFESLELRKKLNDPLLLSFSYNNIGSTYYRMKNYDEALKYFLQALDIKHKYGDDINIPPTLNNIGLVYQDINQYDKSIAVHLEGYNLCIETNNTHGLATAGINLGIAYDLKGDSRNAEKYLKEAYNVATKNGYKLLIIDATNFLAKFYSNQKRFDEAFKMLELNALYLDSVRNDEIIKELTKMEVTYDFNKKQVEDSISREHEKIKNQYLHQQELRKKESQVWIIVGVFVIVLFVVFILFKSYQYRRKTAEQELQRKTLEIEKNLLKSQMNPHFIFNAMNSIQSFIAVNDTLSAERYLSKFARLIRMILENSTKQTVPLSDEMQALQFYLDLERVRFNYKFDYEVELDDNIEEELICIPPMLIQPFVENAILHGMMHKKEKGNIKINISDDEEKQTLICIIEDNGIGREAAQKLREQFNAEGRKHKSIGMQLTRERLDAINKETGQELNCVIEDLFKDGKVSCGTKVTIRIPYSELNN